MRLASQVRPLAVVVVAAAYGVAAIALAVSETPLLGVPFSLTLLLAVPLAVGALTSLAAPAAHRLIVAVAPWLPVALAARGTVRVFMDSVVVRADSVRLRAKPVDGKPQTVDSIGVGLSLGGGRSWSVVRRGSVVEILRSFTAKQEWSRTRVHFMVPADTTFPVERSWPTFEVFLSVPKTPDNTYGLAWTYAHAPEGFFKDVRRVLP